MHKWAKSLNKGVSTQVIYLDFSKAFDSVPHQRLLRKLDCMGIRAISSVGLQHSFMVESREFLLKASLLSCPCTVAGLRDKPVLSFSSVSPEVFSKGVQLGQNTARERSIETAKCQL